MAAVPPPAATAVRLRSGASSGDHRSAPASGSADRWIVGVRDAAPLARVVGRPRPPRAAERMGAQPRHLEPALRAALRHAVASLDAGVLTHVQVSAPELCSPVLLRCIDLELAPHQAARLVLELTGGEPLVAGEQLAANLRQLRLAGSSLAVSGFGNGYANFQVLAAVRPDAVGIAIETVRAPAIADWFLEACDRIGVARPFVAGIETPGELDWAAGAGFEAVAGGLWSGDAGSCAPVIWPPGSG